MIIPENTLAQLDQRKPGDIIGVCIHHTVTQQNVTAEQIAAMEPFLTIGYNALIRKDPEVGWQIQEGRPLLYVPAAQYGLNTPFYAIAIAGQYQPGAASWTDEVDPAALDLVVARVHGIREKYGSAIPLKYIIGHRDVATIMGSRGLDPSDYSTACPGDNLYAKMHDLRAMTGLVEYTG